MSDANFTGSLPVQGSGSSKGGFSGGTDGTTGFDSLGNQQGTQAGKINFYEDIGSQTQGFTLSLSLIHI